MQWIINGYLLSLSALFAFGGGLADSAGHRRMVVIGIVTGPVLGFALIFADISLLLINVIGAVVFALLVPYIAIGRTLLYFDLEIEAEAAPAKRWRDRLPWRAPRPVEASAPAR